MEHGIPFFRQIGFTDEHKYDYTVYSTYITPTTALDYQSLTGEEEDVTTVGPPVEEGVPKEIYNFFDRPGAPALDESEEPNLKTNFTLDTLHQVGVENEKHNGLAWHLTIRCECDEKFLKTEKVKKYIRALQVLLLKEFSIRPQDILHLEAFRGSLIIGTIFKEPERNDKNVGKGRRNSVDRDKDDVQIRFNKQNMPEINFTAKQDGKSESKLLVLEEVRHLKSHRFRVKEDKTILLQLLKRNKEGKFIHLKNTAEQVMQSLDENMNLASARLQSKRSDPTVTLSEDQKKLFNKAQDDFDYGFVLETFAKSVLNDFGLEESGIMEIDLLERTLKEIKPENNNNAAMRSWYSKFTDKLKKLDELMKGMNRRLNIDSRIGNESLLMQLHQHVCNVVPKYMTREYDAYSRGKGQAYNDKTLSGLLEYIVN